MPGVCRVPGCEKPRFEKRTLCAMHRNRLRVLHGSFDLPPKPTYEEAFWSNVNKTDGCWLWTATVSSGTGYGWFRRRGAHRVAYELAVGPIPDGLVIDHLCRVKLCVRPDHLEPVTNRENVLRGSHPAVVAFRSGTCQKGHPMADAYVRPDTGSRMCRECSRIRDRRRGSRNRRSA